MSKPPINPDKTTAGIAVDPKTLERVVPESKRPDGTVRKQLRIRPGFTPQEDVRKFRGTRQAQMDANSLPKGHIIGWAPPLKSTIPTSGSAKPLSKSAKKNARRKEKRQDAKKDVPDNWEDDDDDDDDAGGDTMSINANKSQTKESNVTPTTQEAKAQSNPPSSTSVSTSNDTSLQVEKLTSQVKKLGVK